MHFLYIYACSLKERQEYFQRDKHIYSPTGRRVLFSVFPIYSQLLLFLSLLSQNIRIAFPEEFLHRIIPLLPYYTFMLAKTISHMTGGEFSLHLHKAIAVVITSSHQSPLSLPGETTNKPPVRILSRHNSNIYSVFKLP